MNFNHFLGLYREERIDRVIVYNVEPIIAHALGARVLRVYLSAETLRKQRLRHPDLTVDHYRSLRPTLAFGEYRQESPRTAMVLFLDTKLNDWGFRAHVKSTRNGRELYVDSFCLMRRKTYNRALAKPYPIIKAHRLI